MPRNEAQLRRMQILAVAGGVVCALGSLLGGSFQIVWLARLGAAGFLTALAVIVATGILAWRRYG